MNDKITLKQYVDIFNFLSKIIYYSCDDNISPLSVRRLKCNDLIPAYTILDRIQSFLETTYDISKVKFVNLYSTRIDDNLVLSVVDCSIQYKNADDYKYLRPFSIANATTFDDDQMHIFLFIDNDFHTGIDFNASTAIQKSAVAIVDGKDDIKTNHRYFVEMLNSITHFFVNRQSIKSYSNLVSAILYNDGDLTSDEAKYIDKILKEACASNTDYIRIEQPNTFREILDQYIEPTYIHSAEDFI